MAGTARGGTAAGGSADGRLLPAVVAGVTAAVAVAALLLTGVVPALAGARTVTIETADPGRTLAPGALAVVRPTVPAVGDLVAVAPGADGVRVGTVEAVTVHGTVVSSEDGRYSTVPGGDVEGVLYGVPWVGALWSAVSTPSGMFFLAALLLLLVAGQQVRAARRRHTAAAPPV